MSIDADQRARLLVAKLGALVRAERGIECSPTATGSVVAASAGGTVFVLLDDGGPGGLGGALLWASRHDAESLVLFVDSDAGRVARLAGYFDSPSLPIEVRAVAGASSVEATPEPVPAPIERPELVDGSAQTSEIVDLLHAEGLEVVVEHGVLRGEVLGLEVARAVVWPSEVGGDDLLHLEAGVGRFDRDAAAAVHPDEDPAVALARATDAVRRYRYEGATAHPLSLLARERWLRADAIATPSLVGAASLRPADMTTEPAGMKDSHPAAAMGATPDGDPVLVVCSTGFDLALVPLAADTRALHDPDARLVIAVPERDLHAATAELVGMLVDPAELVAVPTGWG
ncbi:MAG: hypothetical protein M3Y51_04205 [Actinomycetota bacterium]|nr:hypothetical protein [Actinomycetota bacterium]